MIGLLWFDNGKSPLAEKVQRASAYYEKKYGRKAEICLVHPGALKDEPKTSECALPIRVYRYVLPGHLWLVHEDPKVELAKDGHLPSGAGSETLVQQELGLDG